MKQEYLLGLDAGGTKVAAFLALLGSPREVVASAVGGPANITTNNENALANIDRAVDEVCRISGIERGAIAAVALAAAGASVEANRLRAEEHLRASVASRALVVTDAEPLLAVLDADEHATLKIGLICGTGMFCLAAYRDQRASAGGWGAHMDEMDGSFGVARAALSAIARAADGRDGPTLLTDEALSTLGFAVMDGLVDAVNAQELGRSELARLAPMVIECAKRGDRAAKEIVDQLGRVLADLVEAVRCRLGAKAARVEIGATGGLILNAPIVEAAMLARLSGDVRMIAIPEPAIGSLVLAKQLCDE